MSYTIKAHPTMYGGTMFRSRLEARWAAFFDLAGWTWEYEPIDFAGWSPDFLVRFPCTHSECSGSHELLVEVKPYTDVKQFEGHPCRREGWLTHGGIAAFGLSPKVTEWFMIHGHGGAVYEVAEWVPQAELLWREAGNRTQWQPHAAPHIPRPRASAGPCGLCGSPSCPKPNPGSREESECEYVPRRDYSNSTRKNKSCPECGCYRCPQPGGDYCKRCKADKRWPCGSLKSRNDPDGMSREQEMDFKHLSRLGYREWDFSRVEFD